MTDLNLLRALDVLLTEGSVAGAARRLGLSASAMSRTLSRLRDVTGDPLLVRAGRGMVLTPHALDLRERVPDVAGEVEAILRPAEARLDLRSLQRVFTIRANDAFIVSYAARLMERVRAEAPGVRLSFPPKPDKDPQPLRDGSIDLEIGVLGETGPELKVQTLHRDHFVGVVRVGHPLSVGDLTTERYAAADHVVASRRGSPEGPVDVALRKLGLARKSIMPVPSFPAALAVAAVSDMVALVIHSLAEAERRRGVPLHYFELPVETAHFTVSQIWHPRLDHDPGHKWLRSVIRSFCRPGGEGGVLV